MEKQETQQGNWERMVALELWEGIGSRTQWPALPDQTVAMTIARYESDELGAAMAADITHALVPELPLDGMLDDAETEPIDGLVEIMRNNGLSGITIDDVAEALNIDLSMGAFEGIMTMHAALSDASLGNLEFLRERFAVSDVLQEDEEQEFREHVYHQTEALMDETDEPTSEEYENNNPIEKPAKPTLTIVKDESGEEFDI